MDRKNQLTHFKWEKKKAFFDYVLKLLIYLITSKITIFLYIFVARFHISLNKFPDGCVQARVALKQFRKWIFHNCEKILK